ncbi:hypothetical protein MPER_14008, partial [Moniliophthora perniciosa FA553]
LPNVSPETGEKDKAVPFKVIMKFRMGVDSNHKHKADGVVTVGDEVSIRKVLASRISIKLKWGGDIPDLYSKRFALFRPFAMKLKPDFDQVD